MEKLMPNPINQIVDFNVDRNLVSFDSKLEYNMLFEELQEFMMAAAQEDEHEMVDGLCDVIVVAVGAIYKLGYYPDAALLETVREISSRKGAINQETGKWQKDLNQDPSTLYKADYITVKR